MNPNRPPSRFNEIQQLRQAVREHCGCDSIHRQAVPVYFQGRIAYDGVVDVFELINSSQAKLAYAWSRTTEVGATECVVVLGVEPIRSADDAVQSRSQQDDRVSAAPLVPR